MTWLTRFVGTLALVACTQGPPSDPADPGGGGAVDPGPDGADLGAPVTLGPDLATMAPDSPFTCADGYPIQANPTFPQLFYGQGAGSCLITTFFDAQPPGAGVIVSASVASAVSGSMRFVRMRIMENARYGTACCSVEEYGPIFQAQAGAATTSKLGFVMEFGTDIQDTGGLRYNDWLGLEILDGDVPIPGVWTQNGGADLALPTFMWLPSFTERGLAAPTQNLRSEGSYSGFLPAWSVKFRPAP